MLNENCANNFSELWLSKNLDYVLVLAVLQKFSKKKTIFSVVQQICNSGIYSNIKKSRAFEKFSSCPCSSSFSKMF